MQGENLGDPNSILGTGKLENFSEVFEDTNRGFCINFWESCKQGRRREVDGSHYSLWLTILLLLTICFLLWFQDHSKYEQIGRLHGRIKLKSEEMVSLSGAAQSLGRYPNLANLTSTESNEGKFPGSSITRRNLTSDATHFPKWERDFTSPKIYVYPLPYYLATCDWDAPENPWNLSIYGVETMLPPRIRNSQHVTHDPEEADFFYVPTLFYCNLDRSYHTLGEQTLDFLELNSIYWRRKNGSDHIFLFTQDHGICGSGPGEGSIPGMENSIILSHWGMKSREIQCGWKEKIDFFGRCRHRQFAEQLLDIRRFRQCYIPGKDIVIPPAVDENAIFEPVQKDNSISSRIVSVDGWDHSFTYPQYMMQHLYSYSVNSNVSIDAFNATLPKKRLLFFIGSTRPADEQYSHGVRQTITKLFQNDSRVSVHDSSENDGEFAVNFVYYEMAQSVFCLAVTGGGWGIRFKQALISGCIPVVIADNVEVEFEEVLPMWDFALRIPQHAIYRLPELLEEVVQTPGRV